MKRRLEATLLLMAILTAIYIGVVVYAKANYKKNANCSGVVYAATEYESAILSTDWYKPEQLGIIKIIEYKGDWLHIVVDQEKQPFPLQSENPIFQYKSKFYQVSSLWFTPGLPESIIEWQILAGGALVAAWICTGILFLRGSTHQRARLSH